MAVIVKRSFLQRGLCCEENAGGHAYLAEPWNGTERADGAASRRAGCRKRTGWQGTTGQDRRRAKSIRVQVTTSSSVIP
jgi:hypothetical protein